MLVAWYRSPYAPRTGGAYDSHHRTAGISGCTRRRSGGLAARGARATKSKGGRHRVAGLRCGCGMHRGCGARSDFHRCAAGRGAGLSRASDHAGRAVSRRRRQRCAGTRRCREDVPHARPADRGGEPRRRWRHNRDASRRQGHARWLHHPAHLYRHALYQSDALSQCRIRSAQGLRPDRADRLAAERADGASVATGAHAGKINYGFVPGTIGQMATEMFARSTGIELTRIPYKGNGQAVGDLIGGHVSMMVLSLSTILGNVKTGKLFALAVTTPDRSKLLPDVPTLA